MTAKGLSAEWWQVWNCVSQWRASPGLAPHWFRKAWISRCTSERPPGDPGVCWGAGGGVHDGSSAAGELTLFSEPTASSSAGGAGAQAVLSRRPGLAPLAARRRVLPLSLRAPPFPRAQRSIPPAAVARRAQANRAVAMTTKPAHSPPPPRSDCLSGAPGTGGLLICRGAGLDLPGRSAAGGKESPRSAFEEGQTVGRRAGPAGFPALGGTEPTSKDHVTEIKGGGMSLICCQGRISADPGFCGILDD